MNRGRLLLLPGALLLGLLAACGEASTPDATDVPSRGPGSTAEDAGPGSPEAADWVAGATSKGTYRVRWKAAGGPLPLNEYFALEVELARAADDAALEGAEVNVRADMPAHGHGMNVVPTVREVGDGRYRAEGMLLHMRGHWKLGIDVIVDGTAESVAFDLNLG